MLSNLRVTVPDRPGALAGLTRAISQVGADIVDLSVVDHHDGQAIDDICIQTGATPLEAVRAAAESVPGVVVESLRTVERPRDHTAAVELAARLAGVGHDHLALLVDGLPEAVWCTWAMSVHRLGDEVRVLAASPGAPVRSLRDAPWLPIDGACTLRRAGWMPPAWQARSGGGGLELAAAPLGGSHRAVVVARHFGAAFRRPELRQLEVLAGIAAARLLISAEA